MRIQFDISEEDEKRYIPFIVGKKSRHIFGYKALMEWISRQEGNEKRRKQ